LDHFVDHKNAAASTGIITKVPTSHPHYKMISRYMKIKRSKYVHKVKQQNQKYKNI